LTDSIVHTTDEARPPSFAADIRPLFRDRDILAMSFIIDLAAYDDVRENAQEIVNRIADNTMPCDLPWPAERLDLFKAWVDGGMDP
jgi:hypothetical protein